jgi:hypothetical protein
VHTDLNWRAYFDIADQDLPFEDKLAAYVKLARERFDVDRFEEFCDRHLSHLDEVAHEYFASDAVRAAIREKVEALYPAHEHDEFSELFWKRIQYWRQHQGNVGPLA